MDRIIALKYTVHREMEEAETEPLDEERLVPGFYSTKFNFSCTTEGKIGDTRYKNLGLLRASYIPRNTSSSIARQSGIIITIAIICLVLGLYSVKFIFSIHL